MDAPTQLYESSENLYTFYKFLDFCIEDYKNCKDHNKVVPLLSAILKAIEEIPKELNKLYNILQYLEEEEFDQELALVKDQLLAIISKLILDYSKLMTIISEEVKRWKQ